MIETIKKLPGPGPKNDWKALVKNGAIIVDVRTKGEYQSGHIEGSHNIPLDSLSVLYTMIPQSRVVITCCASGMRSASARAMLQAKGYEVYNGGGWTGLQHKLR